MAIPFQVGLFLCGTICLLTATIDSYPTGQYGDIVLNTKRRITDHELGQADFYKGFNNTLESHDGKKSIVKRSTDCQKSVYKYCCGKICGCIKGIDCPFNK